MLLCGATLTGEAMSVGRRKDQASQVDTPGLKLRQHNHNSTANMAFCARGWTRKAVPPRTSKHFIMLIFLQFLLTFAQGQGQGGSEAAAPSVNGKETFTIQEELPGGTIVGTIPTQQGLNYVFSDEPEEFSLDRVSGVIKTKIPIDRESLQSDTFDLFVQSVPSPKHLIEVRITVLDKNDNAPEFKERSINVSFSENDQIGTWKIIDTATDRDNGINGTTSNYTIVSGNTERLFELGFFNDASKPILYLKNKQKLDREEKEYYQLNISVQDGGSPPKYGYILVNISVSDVNDQSPVFDHSEYCASVNETTPPGTSVIRVQATDNDVGINADISYKISQNDLDQFDINKEGVITTTKKLVCTGTCDTIQGSTCDDSNAKCCVITIVAQDGTNSNALTGRTYVTVTLVDENNNDPVISIRYLKDATMATVDEGAKEDAFVAMVSVTDEDEGDNAKTEVSIIKGNELGHFKLRTIGKLKMVQVTTKLGKLDREYTSKYNLTLEARDMGTPPRSSTAFVIILVNDINDHTPEFLQSRGYSKDLSESVPVGSFVASVTATDNDTGINANITYSIVSGNSLGWFKIRQDTGLVTTNSALDHERMSLVILKIKAQDGAATPFSSLTNLTITIFDENDEVPTFSQDEATVTLQEGTRAGAVIYTASATDADQGLNGSVLYSLNQNVERDYPEMFQLDSTTGKLKILQDLDREINGNYMLIIQARDQGTPPLSSQMIFYLNVTDINDNLPVFYPITYYAHIQENQPVGSYVVQVTATDLDEGKFGEVFYIFKDRDGGQFGIDLRTGSISTLEMLDRETKSHYRLVVSAYDDNDITHQASTPAIVEVTVTDMQDSPPEFSNPKGYAFDILEDDNRMSPSLNRVIGQVRASSQDTENSITYAISSGDQEGVFAINANTGSISTAKALDHEHQAAYSLKVIAKDSGMFAETTVNITLVDINDNAPSFGQDKVEAYVVENWPVGHDVYLAAAFDPDDGDNALITYTVLSGSSDKFGINPQTGMIFLAKSLSQTTETTFTMKVKATDMGASVLFSQLEVTIIIRDVNDHTPRFEQSSYEVSVSESRPVNDRFFRVIAEDRDNGLNGEIVYSIVKGNSENQFGIFPDGIMYVGQTLDREMKNLYVLTVEAVDKGVEPRSSEVNVTINVLDANDNRPVFGNRTYDLVVLENSPAETYVGSVTATDADLGRNSEISYKLDAVETRFEVNPKSGAIITTQAFDREELLSSAGNDVITFLVIASDNGEQKQQDQAVVNIRVTDANDNMPRFSKDVYEPSLYENAEIYTQVVKVSATDRDVGVNSKITFSITAGNEGDVFAIDDVSGQVTLSGVLDRETMPYYALTVMATDQGNPAMSSTAEVRVAILDNNDNPPVFVESKKIVDTIETSRPGTYITQVTATDADIGNNAQITYQISGGNDDTMFHIDGQTGKLYLSGSLDYEKKEQYRLNIYATDFGNPQLSSNMTCVVNILDFNDNAPQFASAPMIWQIQEGSEIGTSIVTIVGSDPDSGINGELEYSISQQIPPGDHFTIDPVSGKITTASEIDRELSDNFKLTVVATDQALPVSSRKTADKLVTVIILDKNDNPPKFVSMNAVALMQGSSPNSLVTTVEAIDLDDGVNGEVEYSIISGDTSLFRINSQTGQLYLQSTLQSQIRLHEVTIQATDKGASPKSSSYQLTIFSRSATENGPAFSQSSYSGDIYENEPSGKSIVTVSASYSGASSANVEYYITSIVSEGVAQFRYFQVHPTSGVISTAEVLDRETGYEDFTVEVYAVDTGSSTPRITTTQVQITVLDRNDSPPVFEAAVYDDVEVPEEVDPGYRVVTVEATDADREGTVQYRISQGGDGKFAIDPTKGELFVLSHLDRETSATYSIHIQASDGVQDSEAVINILVTDFNDQAPVFSLPWYSFDIMEDARTGTTVGRVSAMDSDEGQNSDVTYGFASYWGRDMFSLDPSTGILTLIGRLDYEQEHHYVLTLRAQDSGPTPLSGTVTVYMNVVDINDNAPMFDPSSYSDEVWENATMGTSILTVSATDTDSGINSAIRYSITGGDKDGQFTMDEDTGVVYTAKALDREDQAYYNLAITATDNAQPEELQLSSTTLVSIILRDTNDNAPEFVSSNQITVMENMPSGSSVFKVEAVDRDEGRNGYVEYKLRAQDEQMFSIGPVDGVLQVRSPLNRESQDMYSIQVIASDKGMPPQTSTSTLTIKVGDENDNPPAFNPKSYQKTVAENVKVGTKLLVVMATDGDVGLNADIRYFIVDGDDNQDFWLDSHTGEVYVQKHLDYERNKVYSINIMAQDQGELAMMDTATLTITITDTNDNAPVFIDAPYVVYVRENVENLPVHVMQITARDDDSLTYARIAYTILDGDRSLFKINTTSGEILAQKTLDREEKDSYQIIVRAMDSGFPRLSSTSSVTILVEDVNDNTPVFDREHYETKVAESGTMTPGFLQVHATDADDGPNAQIRYALVQNPSNRFLIDGATGSLSALSLDREQQDKYELVVMATDGGLLSRSSTATVTVIVTDNNDNHPQFTETDKEYTTFIRDPTRAGRFVLGVTAVDRDIGPHGDVGYSVFGTDMSSFEINSDTGVITAKRDLSGSRSYTFRVRATDKGQNPLSDEATVQVSVLSSTMSGFPVFQGGEDTFTLAESTGVGHTVSTVFASTQRGGVVIAYSIAGGNIDQTFAINQNGQVSVAKPIDHEKADFYELWIEAKDNGNPQLSDFIKFEITILDENDNSPSFEKNYYSTSVTEEEAALVSVIQVTATDLDTGDNGRITYRLASGNTGNAFIIDSTTGQIQTNIKLNREAVEKYSLEVEAVDHGEKPRTATAVVDVIVQDKNDEPPNFKQHFYTHIPENSPVGSFVLKITSTDADIGANAVHTYGFTQNPGYKFAINPDTGEVTVAGVLDYESKAEYTLRVSANDKAYNSETTVSIYITDINDNAPVFESSSYVFSVVEMQNVGLEVGQVSAQDWDSDGSNAEVFYMMKTPTKLFMLETETGRILTRQSLEYKQSGNGPSPENVQKLTILAMDRGEPPMSSEAQVTINIQAANKNAPEFGQTKYMVAVAENAAVATTVTSLTASDLDGGDDAEVEYTILSGNGTTLFDMNKSTGLITVSSSLDGAEGRNYQLVIKASDQGTPTLSSTATVIIQVAPVNFYVPQFTGSAQSFQRTIPENQALGVSIARVSATDEDQGTNGMVSYYITGGDPKQQFSVDESQGVLLLEKALDYEETKIYYLNMTARDRGLVPREKTRLFTVFVTDVNDNAPQFESTQLDAFVEENSPSGTIVVKVEARDIDTSPNAIVEYYVTGNVKAMDKFSIDKDSGIITSQGAIDYERDTEYKLSLKALNSGRSLSGTTTVNIHVTGENEYVPEFEQEVYQFIVSESASTGQELGAVKASDDDAGVDGEVYYYLVGDSNLQGFSIEHETGMIYVSGQVDRESVAQVVLTVMAKNWGPIRGNDTSTCQVQVMVRDANDPPQFTETTYEAYVQENTASGTSVIQVSAIDNDLQSEFRNFEYRIMGSSIFTVNSQSGWISTSRSLDRETVPVHNITVIATDSGNPPKTGTATVKVHVEDVNDNGPYFIPSTPEGIATENTEPYHQIVANLVPLTFDLDLSPNRGPYQYQLIDHIDKFDVGLTSGLVQAKVRLDREMVPEYSVNLRVTDNGSPKMTSTLELKVVVTDENDNPSRSRPLEVIVLAYDGQFPGGVIADVRPQDPDVVGSYGCSIVQGDLSIFSIPKKCALSTDLVFNGQQYRLNVTGSDGVHPAVSSIIEVGFQQFDEGAAENSIMVQLEGTTASEFLQTSYKKFLASAQSLLKVDIVLFGMGDVDDVTELFLSGKQTDDSYLSQSGLSLALQNNKASLEIQSGITIEEINYNPCSEDPCLNDGECTATIEIHEDDVRVVDSPALVFTGPRVAQKAKCICAEGFSGDTCEIPTNRCEQNPCKNGGTCLGQSGSVFTCSCSPGWSGSLCEQDINECTSNMPCKHGGSCSNTIGSYRCQCPEEFSGPNCDNSVDFCTSSPCQNDGTCIPQAAGYTCTCKFGVQGTNCEQTSRGFHTLSYMELPPVLDDRHNSIILEFSTISRNALLLYSMLQGSGEFVALEIINGRVRFSFALGSGSAISRLTVPMNVATGSWYKVQAQRNNNVGRLMVSECPTSQTTCNSCLQGDPQCSAYDDSQSSQVLNMGPSSLLTLGGIRDFSLITQNPGQVNSHDFVGCMRTAVIENVDLLYNQARATANVTDTCPRQSSSGMCVPLTCQNGGTCIDLWSDFRCLCQEGFSGKSCQDSLQPVVFGSETVVVFSQREDYVRDQALNPSRRRRRRAVDYSTLSITFRTTQEDALLFYSSSGTDDTIVHIATGELEYVSRTAGVLFRVSGSATEGAKVNDAKWHNVTIVVQGGSVNIDVDGKSNGNTFTGQTLHDPLDIQMTSMSVGGSLQTVTIEASKPLSGFTGCIQEMRVDGDVLPFDQPTERFTVEVFGGGEEGEASCEEMLGATASKPLHVAVIVVISFFVIVLFAILVAFVIIKYRRMQKAKQEPKLNGNAGSKSNAGILDKTGNDSRSHQDSGYTESGEHEEAIIRQHIADEMASRSFNEREVTERLPSSRPDVIVPESEISRDDNIMDNVGIDNGGYSEEPPEHYDIENASSIAPSDLMDVVGHYKRYRSGMVGRGPGQMPPGGMIPYKHPHRPPSRGPPSRESPMIMDPMRQSPASMLSHRASPNMMAMQSTPLVHGNPAPMGGYHPSPLTVTSPSPLTVNNVNNLSRPLSPLNQLSRASPLNQLSRASPANALRDGPSPAPVSSLRSTPVNGLYGPPNNPNIYHNGHMNSRPNSRLKQPINQLGMRGTPTRGLTVEDVERLNARTTKPNAIGTLDAISSSTEAQSRNIPPPVYPNLMMRPNAFDPGRGLEPPETSSDDGSNDSFTCSEFEDDNYKIRNDYTPNRLRFPKLPETENENDDTDMSRTFTHDGSGSNRDSLSTFFASEDELPKQSTKLLNGALNLDYFLNWGPNFEKLVGVFKDIAELPDAAKSTPNGKVHLGPHGLPPRSPHSKSPHLNSHSPSPRSPPSRSPRSNASTPSPRSPPPQSPHTVSPHTVSPPPRSPYTVSPSPRSHAVSPLPPSPHPRSPPPRSPQVAMEETMDNGVLEEYV